MRNPGSGGSPQGSDRAGHASRLKPLSAAHRLTLDAAASTAARYHVRRARRKAVRARGDAASSSWGLSPESTWAPFQSTTVDLPSALGPLRGPQEGFERAFSAYDFQRRGAAAAVLEEAGGGSGSTQALRVSLLKELMEEDHHELVSNLQAICAELRNNNNNNNNNNNTNNNEARASSTSSNSSAVVPFPEASFRRSLVATPQGSLPQLTQLQAGVALSAGHTTQLESWASGIDSSQELAIDSSRGLTAARGLTASTTLEEQEFTTASSSDTHVSRSNNTSTSHAIHTTSNSEPTAMTSSQEQTLAANSLHRSLQQSTLQTDTLATDSINLPGLRAQIIANSNHHPISKVCHDLQQPTRNDDSKRSATAPTARIRRLPSWVLGRRSPSCLPGEGFSYGAASVSLAALPQVAWQLSEALDARAGLRFGTACRSLAAALHRSDGRRVWPHAVLALPPESESGSLERAAALASAVDMSSILSISVYGATDATLLGVVQLLGLSVEADNSNSCGPQTLRLRCSAKGSAGAVEKRNRFGDFMGFGDEAFHSVFGHLARGLVGNSLRSLDLAWNHLCDASMAVLQSHWPPFLEELCLDWNNIGEVGAKHMAAALVHGSLVSLDLRSNPLCDAGVTALCGAAAMCPRLAWLGLGETMLTDAGAVAALPLLDRHPGLTGLDVGENLLTDAACEAVAAVLSGAPQLRRLLLRGFLFEPKRIRDEGGRVLAAALSSRQWRVASGQSQPLELELDYQQVGCATASELAKCCVSWRRLSLFNTDVSTLGAMALAKALQQLPEEGALLPNKNNGNNTNNNNTSNSTSNNDNNSNNTSNNNSNNNTSNNNPKKKRWLNVAQCRISASAVAMLRRTGLGRLDVH
ncbi:unnamed protein product, partial [Polarella glacialis]